MGLLDGKVAIITGASKGIGRALSLRFAREGAAVVCAARSADLVKETTAEVKAAGRAAILVPLPFAADDHQTKNAQAMVDENAAVMIRNAELTGEKLAETIRWLFSDPSRLAEIERNARRIAVLDAERLIVDLVDMAVQKKSKRV